MAIPMTNKGPLQREALFMLLIFIDFALSAAAGLHPSLSLPRSGSVDKRLAPRGRPPAPETSDIGLQTKYGIGSIPVVIR